MTRKTVDILMIGTFTQPKNLGWRKIFRFDWGILALILLLGGISMLMLYGVANGDASDWMMPQAQRFGIGLFGMMIVAFSPPKLVRAGGIALYFTAILLLIATKLFGVTVNGATRWIDLGSFRLQMSEFAKLAVVVALANYYAFIGKDKISKLHYIFPALALIFIPVSLVVIQPDLGTSLFIVVVGITVMFHAGVHWFYYALGIALSCLIVWFAVESQDWDDPANVPPVVSSFVQFEVAGAQPFAFLEPHIGPLLHEYQYDRINTFMSPEDDPRGDGYQISQGKIAMGAGGWQGTGFMRGSQSRLNFLPENHTDFIFTSYAEYFGYIGTLGLLTIFGLINFFLTLAAIRNRDRYSALLIGGVSSIFFLFYMINIAMVMGLAPVVGLPLPFISYGGSSLLMLFLAMGMVQNAHINRPVAVNPQG